MHGTLLGHESLSGQIMHGLKLKENDVRSVLPNSLYPKLDFYSISYPGRDQGSSREERWAQNTDWSDSPIHDLQSFYLPLTLLASSSAGNLAFWTEVLVIDFRMLMR